MSDRNDVLFLKRHRGDLRGPVLECGALRREGQPNFREWARLSPWIGVDLREGPGVDCVADLSRHAGVLNEWRPLPFSLAALPQFAGPWPGKEDDPDDDNGEWFGLFIAASFLEHCADPFGFAANLTFWAYPGAHIYVSVPFVWRMHDHPEDYWRITPAGLRALFPTVDWLDMAFSTSKEGEFLPPKNPSKELCFSASGRNVLPRLMLHAFGRFPDV